MCTRLLSLLAVSLLVSAAGADAHSPKSRRRGSGAVFVENRPMDIGSYVDAGRVPKFIRVNVKGYNIRSTPDFESARTGNIELKSKVGSLYPVNETRALQRGVAVGINVDGQKRWIYVPFYRKADFQFCESEACFADMAESLNLLVNNPQLNTVKAQLCDLSSPRAPQPKHREKYYTVPPWEAMGERAAPAGAPRRRVSSSALSGAAPEEDSGLESEAAPRGRTAMAVKPFWELARGSKGALWTRQVEASLDRYGDTLLSTRRLGDANVFCPNYSALNDLQRKEFWVHLFSAIGSPESSYNDTGPVFDETTRENYWSGILSWHGLKHFSMGLLGMTYKYADMRPYREACSGFDANRDKGKRINDPSLTIYDTQNQFDCAVGIMNHYVENHGAIGYNGEPAWSSVRRTNPDTRRKTLRVLRRYTPCFGGGRRSVASVWE